MATDSSSSNGESVITFTVCEKFNIIEFKLKLEAYKKQDNIEHVGIITYKMAVGAPIQVCVLVGS